MTTKKIISIICALLIFVSVMPQSLYADDSEALRLDAMKGTVHESDSDARDLMGTDIVFMTSVGCFYANGAKHKYSDIGAVDAYYDSGSVMVDCKVLSHIFGSAMPDVDTVQKGGAEFADASAVGSALSKYVYASDNRHFVILSDTDKGYSNSAMSYINQEDTDIIWRYMQFERPDGDELYRSLTQSSYYQKHPRLFVKYDAVDEFKSRVNSDESLKATLDSVIESCDVLLGTPVQEYKIANDGFRLFGSCSTVKYRLFNLCTAYLLTDDPTKKEQYAQRAWEEMDNACSWQDWNTTVHLLDSGQIGPGIAFAYDVLYDWLGSTRRQSIRDRVTSLYLNECVDMYNGASVYNKGAGSKNLSSNWGAVNASSMLMLSLTFMDEEAVDSALTQKCKYIAANSLQTYEHILTALAPEGTWHEGAGYYEFVEQHLAWALEVLNNVFGETDFNNFLAVPGVDTTIEYQMYTNTFQGSFNKNSQTGSLKYFAPEAFVFAKLYGRSDLMEFYKNYRQSIGVDSYPASYLLFYDPTFADTGTALPPSDRYFSSNGTGIMRGTWFNHDGTYAAISGGETSSNNDTHYDKGSFIFEAIGERWSIDLGRNGNNTMPFLYRTETHSALVIDPSEIHMGQAAEAEAQLMYSDSKDKGALMVYDLSDVYGEWVSEYKRGFLLGDDRNTLIIQDELVLTEDNPLVWNMITKADIEIASDGKSAILTQNGKQLLVSGLCSEEGWSFSATQDMAPTGGWKATEDDGDNDTTDFFTVEQQQEFAGTAKKLCITAEGSGDVVVSVKLSPIIEGETFTPLQYTPVSEWTLPDGVRKQIIRFIDIANGDAYTSDKPVYFSLNLDGEFSELNVSVDGKTVSSIAESDLSCVYSFVIPKSFFSQAGDYLLTATASYPTYTVKKSVNLNVKAVHSSKYVFNADFEKFPESWTAKSELTAALGFHVIDLKPAEDGTENAIISRVQGFGGSDYAMKMSFLSNKVTPYIQNSHSGQYPSENDVWNISFDALTNACDMRMYIVFKKDEESSSAHTIFRNNGTFLNTDIAYQPNTLYHVDFTVDNLSEVYTIVITDSEGRLIAKERDFFDTNYGYCYDSNSSRMAFSTLHSGGEERYFIVDNFSVSVLSHTSVQTQSTVSENGVLGLKRSVFSNHYDVSALKSYIAYYDSDNTLTALKNPDIENGVISVSDTVPENTVYTKIMLWDSDIQPVAKLLELEN